VVGDAWQRTAWAALGGIVYRAGNFCATLLSESQLEWTRFFVLPICVGSSWHVCCHSGDNRFEVSGGDDLPDGSIFCLLAVAVRARRGCLAGAALAGFGCFNWSFPLWRRSGQAGYVENRGTALGVTRHSPILVVFDRNHCSHCDWGVGYPAVFLFAMLSGWPRWNSDCVRQMRSSVVLEIESSQRPQDAVRARTR